MTKPGDESAKRVVPFRGAIFGVSKYGVTMVHGPTTVEDCGLYVHVDDIEKYLETAKEVDDLLQQKGASDE
jgi:hypothetical protein